MFYDDGTPTNSLTNHKRHELQVYTVYTVHTVYTLFTLYTVYTVYTPYTVYTCIHSKHSTDHGLYVPNYMFYDDGTPTNSLTNHKRQGLLVYTVYTVRTVYTLFTLCTVYTVLIIAYMFQTTCSMMTALLQNH